MSKFVASAVIRGAYKIYKEAEDFLNKAIREKGPEEKLGFPETAFYLPMANALLGAKVESLKDALPILEHAKELLPQIPSEKIWLPYLGDALDAGIATLLCEEIIMALRYLYKEEPQDNCIGFFTDTIMRSLGIQLVDGRMPGFAAILGAAPDNKTAVEIVRQLQERNILVFVGSSTNGRSIIDQLLEENVQMGWENYIVPYGRDTLSAIYPLNWAVRSALTFGGLKPADAKRILLYTKERVFAFGLALGELDDLKYATGAGAINMGFPIIADTDIPEIRPSGITTYEALVKELDHKKIVARAIEVRGVKVKVSSIDIPVAYAAAFEGERVRKENLYIEFGGKSQEPSFEYLRMVEPEKIEDGKIEFIGQDIDKIEKGTKTLPLGILVEVAGRKMQKDFEPILERQIHRFINYAQGVMHIGQRDMNWIRISNEAFNKGFRLKHIGVILHAMLHQEYSAIVDKVEVKLYTKREDVERLLKEAKKAYTERDERISGMTDESVDTFYSCLLCQSFAPNHVCIITPERLGLCGAYSWLDAKASFEIMPSGPNQPILKGEVLDKKLGQWKNINDFVYQKSNKTIEKVSMYSLMDNPQSSCVIADTPIIIDNELISIGEFIDKKRGGDDYVQSKVLTLKKGKTDSENIVAMQRFELLSERKKLIKIITKSGNELNLTVDHQVAVDRPEGLLWIPASEIKKGDRIISLRKLSIEEKIPDINNLIPADFPEEDKKIIKQSKDQFLMNKKLFYLMGLVASDGSVFRRGRYEYNIYFINTQKELVSTYKRFYKKLFPQKNLNIKRKTSNKKSFIDGRRVNAIKDCYVCYTNNSIFGILLEYFGIIPKKESRSFKNLLSLPRDYIANFLSGLFDGDGSARLRRYKDKWNIAEVYLCSHTEDQAQYLQLLLKRFGILSNIRKSNSVYKVQLHGSNVYAFSKIIKPVHKEKKKIIKKIRAIYAKSRMDKTQNKVLPFFVCKRLVELSGSKSILSPTTYFYYRTFRSRPVWDNAWRVIKKIDSQEAKALATILDNDFYLDTVEEVKRVKTKERYVYNLTLSDTHCYFASQLLIKNCGCFECIVAVLPEANGVMIVNRDYSGMTPCGMTFTTLAGSVGGGVQTPGFLGIGRLYIVSKKFLLAEGGLLRVVWMTKELKEFLADKLKKRAEELGHPDLVDKIADESQATTIDELLSFLKKVDHPALKMEPLI